MKRYNWDRHNRACDTGGALDWCEMFIVGPDGKRHPTKEEIEEAMADLPLTPNMSDGDPKNFWVCGMLRRLCNVAPENDNA